VARELERSGNLSPAYRLTLATYCALAGELASAHGALPTPRIAELRRLGAELGLTPRSGRVAPADPVAPAAANITPIRG
jgi:phage terminase small subunit